MSNRTKKYLVFLLGNASLVAPRRLEENIFLFFFVSTSRACSVSLRDVNFAPNFEIRKFRGSNSNDIFVVRLFASRRQSLPRQSSAKPFWPWLNLKLFEYATPSWREIDLPDGLMALKHFKFLKRKKSECPQVVSWAASSLASLLCRAV